MLVNIICAGEQLHGKTTVLFFFCDGVQLRVGLRVCSHFRSCFLLPTLQKDNRGNEAQNEDTANYDASDGTIAQYGIFMRVWIVS